MSLLGNLISKTPDISLSDMPLPSMRSSTQNVRIGPSMDEIKDTAITLNSDKTERTRASTAEYCKKY